MRIIRSVYFVIPIILLCASTAVALDNARACENEEEKRIPLPVGETADVLTAWWNGAGYRIQRTEPAMGHVRLHATGDREEWRVRLAPYSPLATRVTVWVSGTSPALRRRQLWDHISRHINPMVTAPPRAPGNRIPVSVLSKIESVVCITAQSAEKDIQFSGFIVDSDGLVLCTAHDLENHPELTVTLYDGRHAVGHIVHRDAAQDLALVHMALKTDTAISLVEGRNLLGMGENVFTVGCPVNLRGTIYAGTINGPPRLVDDMPLWQVQMEIHPGSSGSPVFDYKGNLVGMVKGRYRGTTTLGFLIPLETIIHFLKEKHPL